MTWHTLETYFTVGTPVLHSTIGAAQNSSADARAAIQARLEALITDHPDEHEPRQAAREWAHGAPTVFVGTFAWEVFEAIIDPRLSTHVRLTQLAKAFTEAVGLDLEIAGPTFL